MAKLQVEEEFRHSAPLADRMRPTKLNEVVGQDHLLKKDSILRRAIHDNQLPSLILWGPPGTGKTTIARILAAEIEAVFYELSAVTSGKADITKVIEKAEGSERLGERTVLFIDEIHRFNKAQQDALLPHVEKGTITLVGATTENPSFEVIAALLSRTTVLRLEPLSKLDVVTLIKRATQSELKGKRLQADAAKLLAELSYGDARTALSGLEIAHRLADKSITRKVVLEAMQESTARHDKKGESHYNLASALIKSMRGSQERPALYYLHRLLAGGEDPTFIARRITIFASEDIGVANQHALTLAISAYQAVERIGMPEANYILSQAVVAMCRAKKSREVADLMYEAKQQVSAYPDAAIPLHLRNGVTSLMKDFGYGEGYKWEADFKHMKGFWPDDVEHS